MSAWNLLGPMSLMTLTALSTARARPAQGPRKGPRKGVYLLPKETCRTTRTAYSRKAWH
jgi:hypothetical protein